MIKPVVSISEAVKPRGLQSEILVLNKVWYPINLVPVPRGMCMLFEGSAHAIDESYAQHDFQSWLEVSSADAEASYIQTSSRRILVPEVIVLRTFDKIPKTKAKLSRTNIYKRDGYSCQYCGQHLSRSRLTIDHVLPKSAKPTPGVTSWTNCVASCLPCNAEKADMPLSEFSRRTGKRLLSEPVEPEGRHMAAIHMAHRKRPMWEKFL
jgi:5-methylcytosine-specific restriction endonuclease McrA